MGVKDICDKKIFFLGSECDYNRTLNKNLGFVIKYLPSIITSEEITKELNNAGISITHIRLSPLKTNKSKSTAFITAKSVEDKNKALDNAKLLIGWDKYPVVEQKPQDVIQCFRCQEYNHVAKLCKKENPICLFCSGNHDTNLCQVLPYEHNKFICANCKGNHMANNKHCPVRKREIKIRKESLIKNNNIRELNKRRINAQITGNKNAAPKILKRNKENEPPDNKKYVTQEILTKSLNEMYTRLEDIWQEKSEKIAKK